MNSQTFAEQKQTKASKDGEIVVASFSISSANFKGLMQNLMNADGGQVQARTELIYPKMSSKTFNTLDAYYDKP